MNIKRVENRENIKGAKKKFRIMARRHRNQRIKPQLNVYRETRSLNELGTELKACNAALEEQRVLRKLKVKPTNPDDCIVPEKGIVRGGWRYESKLLLAAAERLNA